jgi:hypothetical protein
MPAIAIARAAGLYALLFSRLSNRESARRKTGVAGIACFRTQRPEQHDDEKDNSSRPFSAFHGFTPSP